MNQKVLIIIPAYNEAEGIRRVIADVRHHIPYADILVVNDGSSDLTGDEAAKEGVLVRITSYNVCYTKLLRLRRYHQFSGPNQPQMDENEIEIDELIINISTHQVTVEGQEVQLTPREFAILKLLAVNQGIVLSMEKIYQEVWNEPFMESKNTVMVHIRRIREKIEKDTQNPKFIKTVWGIGFV